MVRISTRGRYALRAMVDLAQHASGRPVPRHDIAARQEISADYTAQLFRRLQSAGLVQGVKGPGGGYLLTRRAAQISVGEIVRAVEGPLTLVDCAAADLDGGNPCSRVDGCITRLVWKRLAETVAELLDSINLQDLCDGALA